MIFRTCLATFFFSLSSLVFASRFTATPPFVWQDWIQVSAPWPASSYIARSIHVIIKNISPIGQTGQLLCGINPLHISSNSGTNPSEKLNYRTNGKLSLVSETHNFSLGSYESVVLKCGVDYFGPVSAGDWHMGGIMDVSITVNEDRGALTALYSSLQDATAVSIDNTAVFGMLRNISKTIFFNGGRPF